MISSASRRPQRRRSRVGPALVAVSVVVLLGALTVAALLAWPATSLQSDPVALARVSTPWTGGTVGRVVVRDGVGTRVPVTVAHGAITPVSAVRAGELLTVAVTVRRPRWASWLVGATEERTLHVDAPRAEIEGRWLEVRAGTPLVLAFDRPVRRVTVNTGGGPEVVRLSPARSTVHVGTPGNGLRTAGTLTVRATPADWERLSQPVHVHWFPARSHVQALVEPQPGSEVAPLTPIRLTFSRPVAATLGSALPTLVPAVPGAWRRVDSHSLAFVPRGLGVPLDTHVEVTLPKPVAVVSAQGETVSRTLRWPTARGSMLRLEQLLAEQGYLPVTWTPAGDPVPRTERAQLEAVGGPPAGRFRWPYAATTPKELKGLWKTGEWNAIVRGAVMRFQDTHGLDVDAFVGPQVWHALLADAVAGKRLSDGYSYVYVHRDVPQLLTLWHDGRVVLTSPGNTGVPAAPTELGTFPVFEHIPVGRMSGTNPDGTHYDDPGIKWISYFNHGEALHAFPRASFGTPQSLGCVELPEAAAKKVWPYTPIGTLVTIEH